MKTTRPTFSSLKEIIERSFSRYIRVLPQGLLLPYNQNMVTKIKVNISTYHPARTRYENKKPICRSLDAVKSLKDKKTCALCETKNSCTMQICLEILYENIPLKLMLAYTSMSKFLIFNAKERINKKSIVQISVINRGKWGELVFHKCA